MPPAQWTTTRFSNGCAATGFDCFEGSRQAARLFFNYSVIIFVPSRGLTQTVTQKQRGQESTGEGRMASSVPLRLFFVGYMVWLMTLPMVSAAERFIPSVAWV